MTVRFKSFITESVGAKGLAYEKKVFDAMKSAGVIGLDVGSKPGAGYSNQGAGDIEALYNGKEFNLFQVMPEMVGYYLGEFSITYRPVRHGRPGIGSTNSSRFIPLK